MAGKAEQRKARGPHCHHPHHEGDIGRRRPGTDPDATRSYQPHRLREPRRPHRFCAPRQPSAVGHRNPRGAKAELKDLPTQTWGERSSLGHQVGEGRRTEHSRFAVAANLALRDVPADQLARLPGQLISPVGQQLIEGRTGFSPGAGDKQCVDSFLQAAPGARSQGMRPAPRHAKGGRKIGVTEVVADAQLDNLTLARLHLGKDAANQHPQFGLPWVEADIGRFVR